MDEETFKKFLDTLDPTLLDVIPEHIIHEEFEDVFESKNSNAWTKILYNHFSEYSRSEIAKLTGLAKHDNLFISGPMTLTKHVSGYYGKTIYIFGDWHGKINACDEQDKPLTILNFFEIYTENIDKFIDIYIESPYIKTESGMKVKFNIPKYLENRIGFISDVIILLSKQPNIRVHMVDLRDYLNITRSNVLNEIVYQYRKKITQKDLKQFLEDYSDIDYWEEMLMSKPVIKQLDKIADKTLLEKLLQFMADEVQKFSCKDYLDLIRKGIRKSIKEKIPIKDVFSSYSFINFYSRDCINLIMDIYLLARLFKTHDVKSGQYHPTEAKNVFIYAGNAHAKLYRRFLVKIGFSEKSIATQEDTRCIRVFKPIVF